MSPYNNYQKFYSRARDLREYFDSVFADPTQFHSKRFVWDFWHMPDRYHHLRTPASHFFDPKIYNPFHDYLVDWGRKNLGCHNITMPVLSCYTDGCFQKIHADVPHGPWAFVFSLTKNHKAFEGGETFILNDSTLNYWQNFRSQKGHEVDSFQTLIPSRFNQLTVFDPRRPHGVTDVKGPRDVCDGRLVIHGWFVNPRPYVVGGLSAQKSSKPMQEFFAQIQSDLQAEPNLNGAVVFRTKISSDGRVQKVDIVSNSVLDVADAHRNLSALFRKFKNTLMTVRFPKAKIASELTIPLVFE